MRNFLSKQCKKVENFKTEQIGRIVEGAAATINWVHSNSGVGFFIKDHPPVSQVSSWFFTQPRGYRFANFVHCYLKIQDERITGYGFYPDSQIYKGRSFFKIPCKSYPLLRQSRQISQDGVAGIEFEQIAGARTLSHSILGGLAGAIVGGLCGILVVRYLMNFPPIWTRLQVRLLANGKQTASEASHSFFPSHSLYTATPAGSYQLTNSYTAQQTEQVRWSKTGWNKNNPWNIRRPFI